MAVVTGALPSVLVKLSDLLVGEYKLQKGVKGDIMFLKSELESMKGALEKLSSKPADQLDIQDRIWSKDLRELSYDIEDSIDTFMVRVKANQSAELHGIKKFIDQSVGLFRRAKIRHEIANEIRDIKSRVVQVHEWRCRYDVSLAVDKPTTAAVDPRLFSQYTEIEELVGIVETRDELINIMMEENQVPIQKGKIVTIVGFGGLGKTTLAHAVYEKIRPQFDCCADVSVSQTPDLKKLFKAIVYQIDEKKYANINEKPLDERQLVNELRKFLRRKSIFPEDYKIEKHRLIWMWIAEGFIQCEKHGESLFDLGESYFNDLICRSMIQPIHGYNNDTIYECRVHDMVLDLICSLSSEGNFVSILNGRDHISPSNTIRRLSLQNGKEHHTETLETRRLQQVRSVVVFPSGIGLMPVLKSSHFPSSITLIPVLRRFQVLRVLDLQDCDLSQSCGLKYLGNQFHLRYLGLCSTNIAQLPEEIGSLQFLQILDVRRNKLTCLPSTVVQLKHLMCLYTDLSTRVPNGIGSLTRLEEMSELLIDDSNMDSLEELGLLSELRVLRIALGQWNDNLVECLGKLQKLRELSVWARGGQTNVAGLDSWVAPRHLCSLSTRWGCWFSTLPAWINQSLVPDLSKLSIAIRKLQQVDLDILGRLPALCYLEMQVGHEDLEISSGFLIGEDSFPCLLSCEFRGFVRPVLFQQGAMPRLRTLRSWFSVHGAREIARCYDCLDLGLTNLPSLQKVSVGLDCKGANDVEVKELRAVLRHATKIHPNRPCLWINKKAVKETDNE